MTGGVAAPVAVAQRHDETPLVEVRDLVKHFPIQGGFLNRTVAVVQAVSGVSFDIRRGETLGVVGESGSGKTTVGRLLLRLIEPTAGSVRFDGSDITRIDGGKLNAYRRGCRSFQDPYAFAGPADADRRQHRRGIPDHAMGRPRSGAIMVRRMMDLVGLMPPRTRYPH